MWGKSLTLPGEGLSGHSGPLQRGVGEENGRCLRGTAGILGARWVIEVRRSTLGEADGLGSSHSKLEVKTRYPGGCWLHGGFEELRSPVHLFSCCDSSLPCLSFLKILSF